MKFMFFVFVDKGVYMQNKRTGVKKSMAVVFLCLTLVLVIAWTTGPFFYHFAGKRLVTLYSLFQLMAIAFFAFEASKAAGEDTHMKLQSNMRSRPFFISSVGFLFLGLDEILSIHENMDIVIHFILRIKENAITDHIDDVIVLIYGFIALFFIKEFIIEFKRHPFMIPLLTVGSAFFGFMVFFDFITGNHETFRAILPKMFAHGDVIHKCDVLRMVEDSCKLIGEAFFLSAFLGAFLNIKYSRK